MKPVHVEQLTETFDVRKVHRSGSVAGASGTPVYRNEDPFPVGAYRPGANQRLADEMTLAIGVWEGVYYSLGVYNFAASGTYTVDVELWDGDPCLPGSSAIPNSHAQFPDIPAMHADGGHASLLEAELDPPIAIPVTVWMAVTFSGTRAANAAWLVAQQAEVGSTENFFSEDDVGPSCQSAQSCTNEGYPAYTCEGGVCRLCTLFYFVGGSPWAGFWAQINAQQAEPPVPAASEWGLVVLSLIGLTAGTILFGHPRRSACAA
jgi:hypothetical protein